MGLSGTSAGPQEPPLPALVAAAAMIQIGREPDKVTKGRFAHDTTTKGKQAEADAAQAEHR